MNEERDGRWELHKPMDHKTMMERLDRMVERYPRLSVTYLGESILGRGIPLLSLGEGDKTVLYVGAHCGTDWQSSVLLLRLAAEYCELLTSGGRIFNLTAEYLWRSRTLCILPMLNPDGVEYVLHGVAEDHVLYDRLRSMNRGASDFCAWKANARGVDLRYNYREGFAEHKRREAEQGILGGAPEYFGGESSESEPEVGQLCNWIRYRTDLRTVIDLHTADTRQIYGGQENISCHNGAVAQALARILGGTLQHEAGEDDGLTVFCTACAQIPAFSVSRAVGESEISGYARLRELFFKAPIL